MSENSIGMMAAGMAVGVAVATGACTLAQDKRSVRRTAHRFACGCEQAIADLDKAICHCMR